MEHIFSMHCSFYLSFIATVYMRAECLKKIIIIIYYIIISYTEVYISCCLCDMYLEHNFMHKKIKCVILIHFPLKFKYFVCIAMNQHYSNFSIVIKNTQL